MYTIGFLSFSLPQSLCFYTSLAFLLKSLTNLSSLTLKERKIMEAILARRALLFTMSMGWLASFFLIHVYGDHSSMGQIFDSSYLDQMRKMQAYRPSSIRHDSSFSLATSLSPSPSSTGQPPEAASSPRVYHVTSYGADPSGREDSTMALLKAISDAVKGPSAGSLTEGIQNLGGAQINLDGGNYVISQPLRLPAIGVGNLMIHGGTLRASDKFPADGYLIDLSASSTSNNEENREISKDAEQLSSSPPYNYEYITLKDLMLDSNYTSGGIAVVNSLRTSIDNCYISHFTTNGILVQGGHETYIRSSFLGQHVTAGGDHDERNFSGTGINLMGNDNAVTNVVIFSAAIGIMVSGQANIISGVHCYNKATGFGGTGIYLKLPSLTQTRIVNSYFDYTGIVAEDPLLLHISNNFFLGDAFILLKSIKGVAYGVNIVDNMFCGFDKGIDIVQLDQSNGPFKDIDQVVIERNSVKGMNIKSTVARGSVKGNGSVWIVDLNNVLLFPNLIRNVQYSLSTTGSQFPNHALGNISNNSVEIRTDLNVTATVFVIVDSVAS